MTEVLNQTYEEEKQKDETHQEDKLNIDLNGFLKNKNLN